MLGNVKWVLPTVINTTPFCIYGYSRPLLIEAMPKSATITNNGFKGVALCRHTLGSLVMGYHTHTCVVHKLTVHTGAT